MNVLFFCMLFAGLIEPKPPAPAHAIDSRPLAGSSSTQSVVVVADGSAASTGSEADAIITRLGAELGGSWYLHVLPFDAGRAAASEVRLSGSNRDLVWVAPPTAMKDAIALALNQRGRFSGLAAIVVIAREQAYPTYVRTDKLISSLQKSRLPVHSIHLAPPRRRFNPLRSAARAISSGAMWLAEALIEEDRDSYSPEATARMLGVISSATGGTAHTASDREAGLLCATKIASRISETSRSAMQPAGDAPANR